MIIANLSLVITARAVIVAGANGGSSNSNNTTGAQLNAALGSAFPYYDNVVQYSDSSGTYLGYNASTRDVWVLSAAHVTDNNSAITIAGQSYPFQQRYTIAGLDLELNRYRRGDLAVPNLIAVPLATMIPTINTSLLMTGYGRNRVETATVGINTPDSVDVSVANDNSIRGYNWSATSIKRWGFNRVSASPFTGMITDSIAGYGTMLFTDFDQPGINQWISSNEAGVAVGDSGGGMFYLEGGQWKLLAMNNLLYNLVGQDSSTTAFGDYAAHLNLSSYSTDIFGITGSLIPEPSAAMFVCLSALGLILRRSRDKNVDYSLSY